MVSENHMRMEFDARSENEGFARMAVASFLVELNPTLDTLEDIRTAVSEAVTNAIVHGYEGMGEESQVVLTCSRRGRQVTVTVEDRGVGIADIPQAMMPFYTTKPQLERSGMGFAFMEAFMDRVEVESTPGEGTTVTMKKYIPEDDV